MVRILYQAGTGSPKRGTRQYQGVGYAWRHAGRTLSPVQRLFTMFPPGLPGLALLLLRESVAVAAVVASYSQGPVPAVASHAAAIVVALVLAVGFLTPLVVTADLALHALIWINHGVDSSALVCIVVSDAIALALLGPGAYSVDCYRFGRRVVILPPP